MNYSYHDASNSFSTSAETEKGNSHGETGND